MIERFNRTLKQMLSIFTHENSQDWDDLLPCLMMAYRATEHKSTGCSPNLMMLGRENSFPIDLMAGLPPDQNEMCEIQYVEWLRQTMETVFQFAHDNLGSSAKRQKRDYDTHLKRREINQNEWVWRWYPPEANKKLGLGWVGPYLVVDDISQSICKVQRDATSPIITVNKDHLKPYQGTNPPDNWLLSNESSDSSVLSYHDDDLNQTRSPDTPNPQLATRSGRIVKPRQILDM
jgi:hypothetical protein